MPALLILDSRPDWAHWLAQDADGAWRWYETHPCRGYTVWHPRVGNDCDAGVTAPDPAGRDWRDTLTHFE